jgi:sec-independent protein translocase protein TatA
MPDLIPLAFFDIGGQELIVLFLAILLLLGPKKLPELARALGKARSEFHKASKDFQNEIEKAAHIPDHSAEKPKLQLPAESISSVPIIHEEVKKDLSS